MSEANLMRRRAEKCRELAGMAGDDEIARQLKKLADEYEAKSMKADAGESTSGPSTAS